MFASNFIVKDSELVHERGEDKLTRWATSQTIESGSTMEHSFWCVLRIHLGSCLSDIR